MWKFLNLIEYVFLTDLWQSPLLHKKDRMFPKAYDILLRFPVDIVEDKILSPLETVQHEDDLDICSTGASSEYIRLTI